MTIIRIVCVALSLLLLNTLAAAKPPSEPVAVNIPALPLNDALKQLARQIGIQVVFYSKESEGINAPKLTGEFTPEAALTELLAGTALSYEFINANTVAIRSKKAPTAQGANPTSASPVLRLAQTEIAQSSAPVAERVQPGPTKSDVRSDEAVPEILVKGSKILNMDIKRSRDDAQPQVIFDRSTIERSGANNVEEFLRIRLPMSTSSTDATQTSVDAGNSGRINLRGLGTNQTLILIDGHRAASTGITGTARQPSLNHIPLSAIERIEVLPTTASGIYGGGATGGVVNVILRRDYSGFETSVTYGNTFDANAATRDVTATAGMSFFEGRTTLMVSGGYSDTDQLHIVDRDLVQEGRARILANNPTFFATATNPPLSATTNFRSTTGVNLVLKSGAALSSSFGYVPYGYVGGDAGAALANTVGRLNLDLADNMQLGGGRAGFAFSPTNKTLSATLRHQFTGALQVFLDGSTSDSHNHHARVPATLVSSFNLPTAAATNPFRQDLRITLATVTEGNTESRTTDRRLVGGLIFQLPRRWNLQTDYTWQRSKSSAVVGNTFTTGAAAAITSGTFNPLRDQALFPLDFSPFVQAFNEITPQESTLKEAALRASGPIWSLPAGPIVLSGSVAHRVEDVGESYQFFSPTVAFYSPTKSQEVDSIYLEARVPLLKQLEAQIAGRRDEYTVNGSAGQITLVNGVVPTPIVRATNKNSSIDPTFGLRWTPIEDLAVRASYGTGFLPPSALQIVPGGTSTGLNSNDPRRGGTQTGTYQTLIGGNADLVPEESESASLGLILTPRFVEGLRLSIDYLRLRKTNNIASLSAQQVIDNESVLPGRVTRGANLTGDLPGWAGPIVRVDRSFANVAHTSLKAYDIQLDYRAPATAWGQWDFFAVGTKTSSFETQLVPTAATVENVAVIAFLGADGFPLKWKFNSGFTWSLRQWELAWTASYFGSYRSPNATEALNQGNGGKVSSQIYHDVSGSYQFGGNGSSIPGPFQDIELRLGVRNVFNQAPPFDASNTTNYYSSFGDPRLANYYLTVIARH